MATNPRIDRIEDALLRLAEAQRRTEERLEQLTGRVDQLAEAQRNTEQRLEQLIDQVAKAQQQNEDHFSRLDRDLGRVKGFALETQYREKAAGYFQRLLRGIRVVPRDELEILADEAERRGTLSSHEHANLMQAAIVVRGQWREDRADAYLVVEVSSVVDLDDVERALDRGTVLARLVPARVVAAVAGERILENADRMARRAGVWQVLDGRTVPPGEHPVND